MSGAHLFLDIRPLRDNRVFRRLWISSGFSAFGSQIASFAVIYYVWDSTHNAALVGLTGLAQLIPLIAFALIGGHVADRVDRRLLVLWTRVGQLVAAVGMAVVVISGTRALIAIYLLIALQTALSSFAAPASKVFIVRLLNGDQLGAGLALTGLEYQTALLASPVIAGLAITAWGVNGCFVFDALTFLVAIYGVAGLPPMTPEEHGSDAESSARSIFAGLRLVGSTPILAAAFFADVSATVLSMPVALFPVINSEKFGGSPATLGLFLPALAIGGVLAGTLSGRITRSTRPGVIMIVGGLGWAGGLAAFAAIDSIWMAIPFLAVAGAADAISVIARGTIVQGVTPDALRGRVNGLDFVVGAGGPQLGNIRAGVVASATSGSTSMIAGGLVAMVCTVAIAILTPSLRGYRTETAPAAATEVPQTP